jgi:hypothetical protein
VVVSARVAKRPTTQPNQKARNKDPHPANDEGGEREPNEGHIGRQRLVASPQPLWERATRNWLRIEGSNPGAAWEFLGIARAPRGSNSLGTDPV